MKKCHLCGIITISLITFCKNFNISINNNEIKQESIFISNTLAPHITIEFNDLLLLQKDYFLLKISYLQYQIYETYINSLIINVMSNYFSDLISYIFNYLYDKIIDYYNNILTLFKLKLNEIVQIKKDFINSLNPLNELPSTSYYELINNITTNNNFCFNSLHNNLKIQINYFLEKFKKDILFEQIKSYESSIDSLKNKIYKRFIYSKIVTEFCIVKLNNFTIEEFNSLLDLKPYKYNIQDNNYYLNLIDSTNNNIMNYTYIIDKNKINNIKCNLLLIIFSIINIIYIIKFIFLIENNNISVYALSFDFIVLGITHQVKYLFFYYSFINDLYSDSEESVFIKLFYSSGYCLSIINLEYEALYVFLFLFNELKVCEGTTSKFFRLIPAIIIQLLDDSKYTKNIKMYLIWYFQIANNIIYNNRYTYPLFYIICFTLDKLILIFLANINGYDNSSPSIIKLLIFIGISIIIIYMQALYGPRFMLNSNYQENNQIFCVSKEELIKLKPKAKYKICPICLEPLFDKNIIKKDNELKLNNNSNNNIEIKAKNIVLNIYFYKEFIKRIFKIGFFDFYEYDIKFLKKYMVIPCGHFYHSNCLEKWIRIKNNCPLCRENVLDQ